jgi:hypothetical protein
MKCIPATFAGRDVTPAMALIEMEDVFEQRMASG